MSNVIKFEPNLDFVRKTAVTTYSSTREWRGKVHEALLNSGEDISVSAACDKLALGPARPLWASIVSRHEFRAFHNNLRLVYTVGQMALLSETIDRRLTELGGAKTDINVDSLLEARHGLGPKEKESRLVLKLGESVLNEMKFIRKATQDHYNSDAGDDAWNGAPKAETVLARTSYGEAELVINTLKDVLEADDRLLTPRFTLGPLYQEDNREGFLVPIFSSAGKGGRAGNG